MSDFANELMRWAEHMKNQWGMLPSEAKQAIGEELVKVFEVKLEELIHLLNSRNADEQKLYQYAHEVYNIWQSMKECDRVKKSNGVPIGGHVLPPLPYPYNALEPYISAEIMRLHHDKHHRSYVDGLNKAERKLKEAREKNDYELIKHWSREAAFHGAGHYLHTIFWNVMSPKGGGEPKGELAEQIRRDFGSFAKFKKHFSEAAEKVEGVGWAMLVWSPRSHRLEILQVEKHQNLSQQDIIPILVLDVWEHAYYLQYKTDRAEYIKNWWNLVNWSYVNERFVKASKLQWQPY